MKTFRVFCLFTISLCLILFQPQQLCADESFVATLDRDEVFLEETATLILSLKADTEEEVSVPIIPSVSGLFIFYRETRQVLSPQGGKISPTREFVYTLFPKTTGTKTIPSIGTHVSGRLLLTEPLTLKVAKNISEPSQERVFPEPSKEPQEVRRELFSDQTEAQIPKAFARVVVDNPRPYLHEPVKVTLWAYATVPFQYQGLKGEPRSKGLTRLKELKTEFVSQEDTHFRDGIPYTGRSVEEQIWFAHQTGSPVLELGELTLLLKTRAKNLFDRSFQETLPAGPFGSHAEPFEVALEPIPLEVRPLPEGGRPEGFSGAVGDFTVLASADKTELEVGQSITLKFQIRGKGNLKPMEEVVFKKYPFATSFRPRSSVEVTYEEPHILSEKTYEMILITNRGGNYTIDPVSFSYFNPKIRKYRSVKTQPISLTIHEKEEVAFASPVDREKMEPELLGKDIYYLKTELGPLRSPSHSLLKSRIFWGIQSVPLFILCLALFWRFYQLYLERNVTVIRRRKAFQTSQTYLEKARRHLAQGALQDYAREAQEALLGYFSDKTGLSKGGLTLDGIASFIRTAGGDETLQKNVRTCLETLQAVQFASTQHLDKESQTSYELAKGVIRQLEKINLPAISKET